METNAEKVWAALERSVRPDLRSLRRNGTSFAAEIADTEPFINKDWCLNLACFFARVSCLAPEAAMAELNAFMRGHRVLSVDRRWVDQGDNSYWAFCVDYLDSAVVYRSNYAGKESTRPTVDYRERLSEQDFAIFSGLRQLRKEISLADSVPIYTVFSNEQLAQMAQSRVKTKADLEAIAGVGDARIEKYGPRVLAYLQTKGTDGAKDETSRLPV